ncbi:outer membrane protein assembly factor BamE [Fastidiosibacter lacustris]|uniref:outer membrane protein assembly factor BamE n=1 Tax=Fastidiosibacter lacustris TaxID=2056695 RepID=UPI000E35081D|nr:outer membrane protein assembly factor BamE [Fastidiosibacter lacustris]
MQNRLLISVCLLSVLAFSGCSIFSPYTPPIQQGKILPQNVMQQIKPGMTPEQIKYILGSPDIIDPFDQNQWNYIYSYQQSYDAPRNDKQLILTFKDNKLISVSGDYSPPGTIYVSN